MADPSASAPSESDPQKLSGKLSTGFVARIKVIKSLVDEVYPKSMEDWLQGFELDLKAEREIALWECMAFTYAAFVENRSHLSTEARQEVLNVTLDCSLGVYEQGALSCDLEHLAKQDVREIFKRYQSAVESSHGLRRAGGFD